MSNKSVTEQIKHYQRDIVKCPENSKRMLRCIERLFVLPVTIAHLQETGVGRSVNELRKYGGEVGAAANALVCKWKSMVKDDEEDSEVDSDAEVQTSKTKEKSLSPDHKSKSFSEESPKKTNSINKKSHPSSPSNNITNNKQLNSPKPEQSSLKSTEHHSTIRSEHQQKDKPKKTDYSSKSESKSSSGYHKSKQDEKDSLHKKHSSKQTSESNRNGTSKKYTENEKKERSKSSSSASSDKNKSQSQMLNKEKYKRDENKHKHSSSKRKYKEEESNSSEDDDTIYKPSSRKRTESGSEDEYYDRLKLKKRNTNKDYHKKSKSSSSEESNSDSEASDVVKCRKKIKTESKSDSEDERSVRSYEEDNTSYKKSSDSDRSSEDEPEESDDRNTENTSPCSEEYDCSPSSDSYIPVEIKKEKLSPQRCSNSNKMSPQRHSQSYESEKYKTTHSKSSTSTSKSGRPKSDSVSETTKESEKRRANKDQERDKTSVDKRSHKSNTHKDSKEGQNKKLDKNIKIKVEKDEDGSIGCESGASFGEALLGLSDKKKISKRKSTSVVQEKSSTLPKSSTSSKDRSSYKNEHNSSASSRSNISFQEPDLLKKTVKLEPLDVDLKATLPEISPHYKPLPHYSPPDSPAAKKTKYLSQEEALSTMMSTKNQRTKVYSGNKAGYAKVPSLFDLCIQVLRDNIEALEYTGGVPYDLLKPVLDRATADQLYQLEHYNPYLVEDTDGLWQFHCNKDFKNKKPEEYETWRELYLRCLDEREKKLEALKTNITQSMAASAPVRKTKLAYVDSVVKPPRNIAKQQMKFGTAKVVKYEKHDLVAKAMVGAASGSPAPAAVPVPAPSRSHLANQPFPIPNFLKKKKAPLMAKALQLIKGNRFKR